LSRKSKRTDGVHTPSPQDPHVIVLGLSGAVPAYGRHLSATALDLGAQWWLFDCGEGTQYQIREAGLRLSRLTGVAITHLHGDHYLGLPGLLFTLSMTGRTRPLSIVAPPELVMILHAIPGITDLPFPLVFLAAEAEHEIMGCTLTSAPLQHRAPCRGYRVVGPEEDLRIDGEKALTHGICEAEQFRTLREAGVLDLGGRQVSLREMAHPQRDPWCFAYVTDTAPCEGALWLARDADVVVHDATFLAAMQDRARETGHSTAEQAALCALEAGARCLVLTHISARIEQPELLQNEARLHFPHSLVAQEGRRLVLRAACGGSG